MNQVRHRQIGVEHVSIHVAEAGDPKNAALLFLHGWPENWSVFEQVMRQLADTKYVVAIDLPGVGWSEGRVVTQDKLTLARYVKGTIAALGLSRVTLVGHDVGGQITYAFLRAYPGELELAVILNAAIPGVEPWAAALADPKAWHLHFHAQPKLPELLVGPHLAAYLDSFFDSFAGPQGVTPELRAELVKAYSRPSALETGFEWHRALEQDAKENVALQTQPLLTKVLYVRGEREPVDIELYVKGLKSAGLVNVEPAMVPNAGHFVPSEQPQELAALLRQFTDQRRRLG